MNEPKSLNKTPNVHQTLWKVFWGSMLFALVVLILSGIVVIKPDQQGVVLRCGRMRPDILRPGTHYCVPWIDRSIVLRPNTIKTLLVGQLMRDPDEDGDILDPYIDPQHLGNEFLTGDENIIYIVLNVQYRVADPKCYLFASKSPKNVFRRCAEEVLNDAVARTQVDVLLTSGKQIVLTEVHRRLQEHSDDLGIGIEVVSVSFSSVMPPDRVADAFRDVASALEDKDRLINEANGQYNQVIPWARAEADRQKQEAAAASKSGINRALGEAARFQALLKEFESSAKPSLAMLRLYLETMESVLPKTRKLILPNSFQKLEMGDSRDE